MVAAGHKTQITLLTFESECPIFAVRVLVNFIRTNGTPVKCEIIASFII